MKKKPVKHDLERVHINGLVHFIKEEMDSHLILKEDVLEDLAQKVSLKWEITKTTKKLKHGELKAPNGFILAVVTLQHRDTWAKEIREEGRGGGIRDGDFWGFECGYLIESLAISIANFTSSKLGRGSRYFECLDAIESQSD